MNRYTDWIDILDHIPDKKNKTILELGCGVGTQNLVDNFKFVYSFETNTRDKDGYWFKQTEATHLNSNWKGFFSKEYPGSPVSIKNFYKDIQKNIDFDTIDVLFVDPGFHNRAECVVYFSNNTNISEIFTHDTNTEPNLYKWDLLNNINSSYTLVASSKNQQGAKLWKK